jgi:hypothetical protein
MMTGRTTRRLSAVLGAALFLATTSPALARPRCDNPAEIGAMQVRQFQINLMVATLKCDGGGYGFRNSYAVFMHRVQPLMARNAHALRTRFAHRGQGRAALDHYLTRLSNAAQLDSTKSAGYCGTEAKIIAMAAALPAGQLPSLAATVVGTPFDSHACRPAPKRHGIERRTADRRNTDG